MSPDFKSIAVPAICVIVTACGGSGNGDSLTDGCDHPFEPFINPLCAFGKDGNDGNDDTSADLPDDSNIFTEYIAGTWHGTIDEPAMVGGYATLTLEINEDGNVTSALRNGANTGLTATWSGTGIADNRHALRWSNGTAAQITEFRDVNHVIYMEETGVFGVLKKGVTTLPVFSASDIVGEFEANDYFICFNLGIVLCSAGFKVSTALSDAPAPLNLIYERSSSRIGVPTCTYEGSMNAPDPSYGVYSASASASQLATTCLTANGEMMDSAEITGYLGADKSFLVMVACVEMSQYPDNCWVYPGSRQ